MPQKGIVQHPETEGAAGALPQARAGRPPREHPAGHVRPVVNLHHGAAGQNRVHVRDDRKTSGGQLVAHPPGERLYAREFVTTYPLEHSLNLVPAHIGRQVTPSRANIA
jgi:hypothetical protein